MKSGEFILEEIRELKETRARLGARRSQIEAEVKALLEEDEEAVRDLARTAEEIRALERARAVLEDHRPVAEPASPGPREEKPVAPVEPPRPATRSHRRSRPDATKAARKARRAAEAAEAAASGPRGPMKRTAREPLTVLERSGGLGKTVPREAPPQLSYEGEITLRDRDRSPTVAERAALLLDVIREQDGSMSQYAMTAEIKALLGCKPATAQTIVSQCVRVLAHDGRIVWTGEKVATQEGGALVSPVWKLRESGEERAAPGVYDPEYAGSVTKPYVRPGDREHVRVESNAFEQGKGR